MFAYRLSCDSGNKATERSAAGFSMGRNTMLTRRSAGDWVWHLDAISSQVSLAR